MIKAIVILVIAVLFFMFVPQYAEKLGYQQGTEDHALLIDCIGGDETTKLINVVQESNDIELLMNIVKKCKSGEIQKLMRTSE